MKANKLETALSRDCNIACLAPLDMVFSCTFAWLPEGALVHVVYSLPMTSEGT